jgi:hypothetical protein
MMISETLDYLNKNSGALSVLFSAVVTIATVAYSILTRTLVLETRRMRQVQTEPKLEITAKPFDFAINIVRLQLRNIGLGPALNVKFKPKVLSGGDGAQSLLQEFTQTNFFKVGLNYLGPGQEIHSNFTQLSKNHESKMSSVLLFDLEFESVTGVKYKEQVVIDMSELRGIGQLGTPNLYSIAKSLEKIKDDFASVTSGYRKINANIFTSEDRVKEQEKQDAFFEEATKGSSTLVKPDETGNSECERNEF